MKTENLIALNDFCASHNIDLSFVSTLHKSGLIRISNIRESGYIEAGQLGQLEKLIRMYYELDINLEGIEVICYLLERTAGQQEELNDLKNRLRIYEPEV